MENFNQFNLSHDLMQLDGSSVNELQVLINQLDKCFKKENSNFAEICFVVYRIKNYLMITSKFAFLIMINFYTILIQLCRVLEFAKLKVAVF